MSSELTHGRIHAAKNGAVATVTIDHVAKHNAMTLDMWSALPGVIEALESDDSVRVIVFQGQGDKAFVSGSDISQFGEHRNTASNVRLYNDTVERAMVRIGAVAKPTMAVIQGYCFGGGVAISLHCDLRYASPGSQFCIPAGKVGVGYHELWLHRLTQLVGPAHAKEMMFTALRYTAEEALRMGLINRIASTQQALELAQAIASLAPITHRASKLAIETSSSPDERPWQACKDAIMRCFSSADYAEGRDAFTAKRAPLFCGK